MAEITKKFSDFQNDECEAFDTKPSFVIKEICPTCIRNPNWTLEEVNPFDMTEAWLDESTCEYKIVVTKLEATRDKGSIGFREAMENANELSDQELIRYAIRKMLAQFDKLIANETVCSFGGCMATEEEILEFREDISEYKSKVDKFSSIQGDVALSSALAVLITGLAGGAVATAAGIGFAALALVGLINNGLLAAERKKEFGLSLTSDEDEKLKDYMRSYFGLELSERLEKLEDLHPVIHPYALEWVARIEETYVDPFYSQPQKYLISIPAQNFNRIPEAPIVPSDKTVAAALEQEEVIVEGATLADKFWKLRMALTSYEYFYAAYQQVDDAVIRQEDSPLERINYSAIRQDIKEFKSTLNTLLRSAGYETVSLWNVPTFGLLKELDKLKIVFNTTDDLPFNILVDENGVPQVFVRAKKCGEYEPLSGALALDKFKTVLAFLARLDEIIIDITALEPRPWLEFTLEFVYPKMIVDYGLNSGSATEEQKNALGCLLEKELGIGDGKLVDSLTKQILSYGDYFTYEESKKSCREADQAISGGTPQTKDERTEQKRQNKARKKSNQIDSDTNRIYKKRLKLLKERFVESNRASAPEIMLDDDTDSMDFADFPGIDKVSKVKMEHLDQWLADNPDFSAGVEQTLRDLSKKQAEWEFSDKHGMSSNEAAELPGAYDRMQKTMQPYTDEFEKLAKETITKEFTIVDELKSTIETIKDIDDLNDFLAIFGICGMTKLSKEVIKCLTGGMTLNEVLDIVIRKIFDWMDIRVFEHFVNGLPENVRRSIDEVIKQEFGEGLALLDVLGFIGENHPNANLRFVSGGMAAEINRILENITKYNDKVVNTTTFTATSELGAMEPVEEWRKSGFVTKYSSGGRLQWDWRLDVHELYDYGTSSFFGDDDKEKRKNERKLKRNIRKLIRERDKFQLEKARRKFRTLRGELSDLRGQSWKNSDSMRDEIERLENEETELLFEWERLNKERFPDYHSNWEIDEDARQELADAAQEEWEIIQEQLETNRLVQQEIGYENETTSMSDAYNEMKNRVWDEHWEETQDAQEAKRKARVTKRKAYINHKATKYTLDLNQSEQAVLDYKETNLGVKVNKLLGAIIIEVIESLFDFTPSTNLFEMLKQFPIPDLLLNLLEGLLQPCPNQSLFQPPPHEFMKTLTLDVCDPSIQVTWPKLVLPPIDFRYQIKKRIRHAIRKILTDIFTKVLINILKKILKLIEGLICKMLEAVGGFVAGAVTGMGADENAFYKAIDEAFCGEDNSDFPRNLAESLFKDNADTAVNLISGLAGTDELLDALTKDADDSGDPNFNDRLANAVNTLAPELNVLLGSPSKVGYFFKKVGSFLPQSDKDRIRALLEEGIPNLPISSAICLTEQQLEEWNKLREQLLRDKGLSPEDALAQINRLNDMTSSALEEFIDLQLALDTDGGLFLAPVQDLFGTGTADTDDSDKYPGGQIPDIDDVNGGIDSIYDDPELLRGNCKEDDPFRNQLSELEKDMQRDSSKDEAEFLRREVKRSFLGLNGIFNEALRDTNDKTLFWHSVRVRDTYLWPNYVNSEEEWDIKNEDAGVILKLVMAAGGGEANGIFPDTVCIKTKTEILNEENFIIDMSSGFSESEISVNSEGEEIVNSPGWGLTEIFLTQSIVNNDKESDHNVSLKFLNDQTENEDLKPKRKRMYYESNVNSSFNSLEPGYFDYYCSVTEKILSQDAVEDKEEIPYTTEYSGEQKLKLTDKQKELLTSINFNYGLEKPDNLRKEIFNRFMEHNYTQLIGIQDYEDLFEESFKIFAKAVIDQVYTDPADDNGISSGFKFGYVSDDIVEEDFTYYNPDGSTPYDKEEEEKILGVYGNDRIIVLNPDIYGGRYTRPPIHILPQPQFGWLQASNAFFGGTEGCDPKTPAALTFEDIGDRIDKLKNSLSQDPRLAQDPDCVSIRPFNLLLLKDSHASMDGVVRSTIRTWAAEFFLKGFGVFTNLDYNENNYDIIVSDFMQEKMKELMMEMGSPRSTRRIRIKRRQYWLTFLEQCVQAYQRMVDIDAIKPPPEIEKALEDCFEVQKNYVYPTRKLLKQYFHPNYEGGFTLPGGEMAIEDVTDLSYFYHCAAAYRIYGDDMFKSTTGDIKIPRKWRFSTKKMRFWTKILAIRIVEEQCKLILSEMLRSELRILTKRYTKTITGMAPIRDIMSYIVGMKTIFKDSSSNYGTLDYELTSDPGDVPPVSEDLSEFLVEDEENPTFIVEKYIKLKDKPTNQIPDLVVSRLPEYRGIMSFEKFEEFRSTINPQFLLDEQGNPLQISDLFGDLHFTYEINIKTLYQVDDDGVVSTPDIQALADLNSELAGDINNFHYNYLLGANPEGFNVKVTDSLLPDGSTAQPIGVSGETGISVGLRISLVVPKYFIPKEDYITLLTEFRDPEKEGTDEEMTKEEYLAEIPTDAFMPWVEELRTDQLTKEEYLQKIDTLTIHSRLSKAFQFEDGNLILPLISEEIMCLDQPFELVELDQEFDLPCLIEKMKANPLYDLMFDKIFATKMMTSMSAIYCMYNFSNAMGFGLAEDVEGMEADERNMDNVEPADPDDDNDRVYNKRIKNALRKKFAGLYLSNDMDGSRPDQEDDSDRFGFDNPFDNLSLSGLLPKIPWFQRRRIVTNPYDMNGDECANPLKDLE